MLVSVSRKFVGSPCVVLLDGTVIAWIACSLVSLVIERVSRRNGAAS